MPSETKRQLWSRLFAAGVLSGAAYLAYDLGREWESDDERKKFVARSDDVEAIEMAQLDGWQGFVGRIRLRGADQLDVSLLALFYFSRCATERLSSLL